MEGRAGPLAGRRVIVVDDETYVAMMLEDMLDDLGCVVVGVAQSVASGLALASSADVDVAVLDVNLGGQSITPVAEALAARGVPILFSTGYGRSGLASEWADRPVLAKPFAMSDLESALLAALSPV